MDPHKLLDRIHRSGDHGESYSVWLAEPVIKIINGKEKQCLCQLLFAGTDNRIIIVNVAPTRTLTILQLLVMKQMILTHYMRQETFMSLIHR